VRGSEHPEVFWLHLGRKFATVYFSFVTRPEAQKVLAMEVGNVRAGQVQPDQIDWRFSARSLVSRKQLLSRCTGHDPTFPAMISPSTDMADMRMSLLEASFTDMAAVIGLFSSSNACKEMQLVITDSLS
jgi:hypothetical protein